MTTKEIIALAKEKMGKDITEQEAQDIIKNKTIKYKDNKMTTDKIMALAKEKLGKDLTEQEAQDYLSGSAPIPDEALDIVSGGGCGNDSYCCKRCGSKNFINVYWATCCMDCGKML